MRRLFPILAALALAACDPSTGPTEVKLDDLLDPPRNHAGIAVTKDLDNGFGTVVLTSTSEYFFPLLVPAPAPRFTYIQESTTAALQVVLPDTRTMGVFTTSDDGVDFAFTAPDGSTYRPLTSCRITVTAALNEGGTGRLQGKTDCPVTNTVKDIRVLAKFDYTPG